MSRILNHFNADCLDPITDLQIASATDAGRKAVRVRCKGTPSLGSWSDGAMSSPSSATGIKHTGSDSELTMQSHSMSSPTWSISTENGNKYNNQLHYYSEYGWPEGWEDTTSERNSHFEVGDFHDPAEESPSVVHASAIMQPPNGIVINDQSVQVLSNHTGIVESAHR